MARKRKGVAVRTRRLAVCALFCAVGVVLLGLGAITEILDLTAAMLVSLLLIPIVVEYGGAYPYLVWAVTGVLGLIIMPQSWATQMYAGFLGFYPIIKNFIERIRLRPVAWLLKLAAFNVALFVYLLVIFFVSGRTQSFVDTVWGFLGDFSSATMSNWLLLGVLALAEVLFVLYDFMVSKSALLYLYRIRQKIKKYF